MELQSVAQLKKDFGNGVAVLDFWADWAQPCVAMNALFDKLASTHPSIKFAKVEAEKLPEVTELFEVAAVPCFVFLKNGKLIDKVDGANGAELVKRLQKYSTARSSTNADNLQERIKQVIGSAPIMLFMKGEPSAPRCGFSAQMVELFKKAGVSDFGSFNILNDDEFRQGLKDYANWPTYPMLFVNSQLIGGLDIVKEMIEEGEFESVLPKQPPTKKRTIDVTEPVDLNQRLHQLINASPVQVFMKGSPENPRCGFSRRMVELLNGLGAKYGSFDILQDEEVRQGLKTYSNWPTYPQLYVNGNLIGGIDIAKQMNDDGELQELLVEAKQ